MRKFAQMMRDARAGAYGVGSFSPRNTVLIPYVLRAAQARRSPAIIMISDTELRWFELTAAQFADAFRRCARDFDIPSVLHLDHTTDMDVLRQAIDAGYDSVMVDMSALSFEENARITRETVALAHPAGTCVEAELGNIGGAEKLETENDTTLYTDPEQAAEFVRMTGCDALAVSVGTAHGVYPVSDPTIDYARLRRIRELTDVALVLHGASGLPAKTVNRAIVLDGIGGASKINIATDIEMAFQASLHVQRMPDARLYQLSPDALHAAGLAVQALCEDRMQNFLLSAGKV